MKISYTIGSGLNYDNINNPKNLGKIGLKKGKLNKTILIVSDGEVYGMLPDNKGGSYVAFPGYIGHINDPGTSDFIELAIKFSKRTGIKKEMLAIVDDEAQLKQIAETLGITHKKIKQ